MKAILLLTLVLSLTILMPLGAKQSDDLSIPPTSTQWRSAHIALASTNPAIPAALVMAGTDDHPIYHFTLLADSTASLRTINFTTQGTYQMGDVNDLKLWYNTTNNFATATNIFEIFTLNYGAGAQNFNNVNLTLLPGVTYHFWFTAHIRPEAVQGRTICVLAINTNDLNFDGITTETGLAYDGGCQTFEGVLPVELSSFSAVVTAQDYVAINWVSQSESNLSGYNVYRNTSNDLDSGILVSSLIGATNTSQATDYNFVDDEVESGTTYYYWLQSLDFSGEFNFYGPVNVTVSEDGDGNNPPEIPIFTQLRDAYPNPFNAVNNTTIPYFLKDSGKVKIEVYNQKGQMIWSNSQAYAKSGLFSTTWNGKDLNGRSVSSGIYSYKMTSGDYISTKKLVLVK